MPYRGYEYSYFPNNVMWHWTDIVIIILLILILILLLYNIFKPRNEVKLIKIEKDVEEIKETVKKLEKKWEEIE